MFCLSEVGVFVCCHTVSCLLPVLEWFRLILVLNKRTCNTLWLVSSVMKFVWKYDNHNNNIYVVETQPRHTSTSGWVSILKFALVNLFIHQYKKWVIAIEMCILFPCLQLFSTADTDTAGLRNQWLEVFFYLFVPETPPLYYHSVI